VIDDVALGVGEGDLETPPPPADLADHGDRVELSIRTEVNQGAGL
jgi:hypothetical protein